MITFGVDGAEQAQRQISGIGESMTQSARPTASMTTELERYSGASTALAADFSSLTTRQTAANAALDAGIPTLQDVGTSAAQTAAALRNVPAQLTDIITSLQGGQEPLTVFMQQGGQLRDMFGGAGAAARALGGYVLSLVTPLTLAAAAGVGLAYSYNQGRKEADAYNRALILTGNAAGTTSGQLADMARNISKESGTQHEAAAALAALAATGKIGAENLRAFGQTAIEVQDALGQSVEDTAKEFADLAKSPLQTTERLNEKYNYLTAAVYAQVKALQDQGRAEEAGAVAQAAYKDAMDERAKGITDSLGYIDRALKATSDGWKWFWDSAYDVGRDDSVAEKIAKLQKQIDKGERNRYSFTGASAEALAELEALKNQQALLQSGQREQNKANESKAAGVKLMQSASSWMKDGEKYLSRSAQLELAITKARNEGAAAQQTEAAISKRVSDIRKDYADIFNDAVDSQIEAVKRRGAAEDIVSRRSMDQLAANKAAGLVAEQSYIEQVAALDLAEFAKRKGRLQEELTLTAGKQNSQKDQAALRGQIAEEDARAVSRQMQLTNDLFVLQSKMGKEVFDQVLASTVARNGLNDSLAVEYANYGKSADARDQAMVAVKSEAALEKYLFDTRQAGKPITDEMIGQLRAEKDMRDQVERSTMAQSKALGYATQLATENKRFAAESIFDEKKRAAALLQIDADVWQERIRLAGEGTEAQRLLQEQYVTWYQNQASKPMLDVWQKSVTQYNDIFRNGFADMLNNGKSGWASFTKSLTTTFKTGVADQIYKMLAQPFVVKMVGNFLGVTGGGIGGAAQAASGAGGALNAAGSASSLYNTATGAGAAGLLHGAGSGIGSIGSYLGSTAMVDFGAGLSGTASAEAVAAALAGDVAAPLSAAASAGSSLAGAFSAALPWVAAAGAAYLVWKNFFESGPESNTRLQFASNNAVGNINNNERGESWAAPYIGYGSTSSLGTFGVRQTFWGDATGEVVQSFIKTVGQTDDALAAFMTTAERASVTGYLTGKTYTANTGAEGSNPNANGELDKVFADRINNILTGVEPGLASLVSGFTGTSQALATEAAALLSYRAALKDSGEAVFGAKVTLQQIAALKLPTETTSAALSRVTNEFAATSQVAEMLGKDAAKAYGAVGLASEGARAQLILLSGGISTFASQAQSFAQTYFTEEERNASLSKQVAAQMAALGYASVTTKDQFKALVMGLDLSTEAGAKQYASLMAISASFATAADMTAAAIAKVRDAAKITAGLDGQIYDLTHTAAEALARQRQIELAAMTASDAELQKRIYALTDEQAASKAAAEASAAAATAAIDKAKADASATQAVYSSMANALVGVMDKANAAAKSLQEFGQSLLQGELSTLSPEARYGMAKAELMNADVDHVQGASSAFLQASKAWFGGSAGYAADFGMVQGLLSSMASQQRSYAASIPAFWKSLLSNGSFGLDGSHANGLDFVPFDGYRAKLHKGERVQTAAAVRDGDAAARETNALLREVVGQLQAVVAQGGAVGVETIRKLDKVSEKLDATKRVIAREASPA